ncbi:Endosome protein [Mycena indigotica]|uniref:Endosome protein n=1 Tax=Mycena indigotica TaxID=2126181 RepID=A0A8H6WBL7_9AGAR|nr:Endosome protein [Mycena indigotica]KAF7311942.1 Endosome protein [Mycena indigotica]
MFSRFRPRHATPASPTPMFRPPPPPNYTPSGGLAHEISSTSNAELEDYELADRFCRAHPNALPARIFPPDSQHSANQWGLVPDPNIIWSSPGLSQSLASLQSLGAASVSIALGQALSNATASNHQLQLLGFDPQSRAAHFQNRGDNCFTSNLPLIPGHYISPHKLGVYFEITIQELLGDATLAMGMQCLPYPAHRLPGWHRRSAALHLDDRRLYFEDSEGGIDYLNPVTQEPSIPEIHAGDTIGCGYEFKRTGVGRLFYTFNGRPLSTAFPGIFDRTRDDGREMDVFAAVGVTNGPCAFQVNFGGEEFQWKGDGSQRWSPHMWTVEGILQQLGDRPPRYDMYQIERSLAAPNS